MSQASDDKVLARLLSEITRFKVSRAYIHENGLIQYTTDDTSKTAHPFYQMMTQQQLLNQWSAYANERLGVLEKRVVGTGLFSIDFQLLYKMNLTIGQLNSIEQQINGAISCYTYDMDEEELPVNLVEFVRERNDALRVSGEFVQNGDIVELQLEPIPIFESDPKPKLEGEAGQKTADTLPLISNTFHNGLKKTI